MHETHERAMSGLDAIFARRSVRAYTAQKLDRQTVESLLDAAVQAPTAMHAEPWAFVIVQDPSTLKRISDRAKASWVAEAAKYRDLHVGDDRARRAFAERLADPDFSIFYDATTLVTICARPGPFVVADCWLAAENLMLAACALGLGTCCIGSALPALNNAATKAELGMPDALEAVAAIIVGVPREAAVDVPRKRPNIVSWK
jgi:nitroreductase